MRSKTLIRLSLSTALALPLSAALSTADAAEKTLTIYTYESFVSEWGPGPKVEKAFEAVCGCDLKWVGVEDGVALLNRIRLEGGKSEAGLVLGLDTNLVAEAKETGYFAPHGIDTAAVKVPGDFADDTFVPYDYAHFAVIYDTETIKTPPASLRELVEGDPSQKIVIQDPRTSTPGLGLLLWVKSVYGDEAPAAWGKLRNRVLTVTPGWSESYGLFTSGEAPTGVLLHHLPGLPHGGRGDGSLSGGALRRGPLSPDRGGGSSEERAGSRTRPRVPEVHDHTAIPERDSDQQLDAAGRPRRRRPAGRLRQAGFAGEDAHPPAGGGGRASQGLDR